MAKKKHKKDPGKKQKGGWGADAVLRACRKVVCRPRGTDQLRGRVVLVDEHRTSRVSSAVNAQQPCEEELDHEQPTRRAGWKPPAGQVDPRLVRPAWSQQRGQPVRGMMWCPVVAPRRPPQAPRSSQESTQPAASEPGPSTPPPAKRSKPAAEPTKGKGKGKAVKAKPTPQPGRWVDRDCNAALNMQRIGESRWRPLELCYWKDQGALPAKGKEYPGLGYKRMSRNKKRKRPVSPATSAAGASGSGQQDLNDKGQAVKEVIAQRRQVIKAALRGLVEAARPDLSPALVDALVDINKRMTMGSKQGCLTAVLCLSMLLPPSQAPPWGRWLDRDTNPCLNLQRIGESMQRPLELCSYEGLEALPLVGKEYQQGDKRVNDWLPKVRQRLHRAAEYRRDEPARIIAEAAFHRPSRSPTRSLEQRSSRTPQPRSISTPAVAESTFHSFLGLANFYRRFVKNFSDIAAPITALTQADGHDKQGKVAWGPVQQSAFEALKKALTTAPVLIAPDPSQPYTLRCDASGIGIGAVLTQGKGPAERVVAYHSRKLLPAERNYPTHEQELLSVVEALKGIHAQGIESRVSIAPQVLQQISDTAPADAEYQRYYAAALAGKPRQFIIRDNLLYHTGKGSVKLYIPRNKSNTQRPIGLLQSLPVPQHRWEHVSLDLITQLPVTTSGHDAIVVFVDKLTKMMHAIPTTTSVTASTLARIFFDHVFRLHGLPKVIVSDRDPRFTSTFWQELFKLTGTHLNMSTANHPQTDGQTERANRTLEDMLRNYVSPHHDDWDQHLTAAEFAYNASVQASTGYSPFRLNSGQEPHTPLTLTVPSSAVQGNSESASAFLQRMASDIASATHHLVKAQERQTTYANKKRRDHTFKVGDMVYLAHSFFAHTQPANATAENATRKFSPRLHGPFKVLEVVTPVALKLQFPPAWSTMHPVVHVSHIKLHNDGSAQFPTRNPNPPPEPEIINGEEHFEVQEIRNHRFVRGKLQLQVKWLGHPDHENTWLPLEQLQEDLTKTFLKKIMKTYAIRTKQPKNWMTQPAARA
ncbi:hypothetical protein QJQ45_011337 [Haematococcus lacustris]|nr:hypothetical protein QJQ45_011337 [Haematococcus lacustris]